MHFIETLLHVDPDHGSGALELVYVLVVVALVVGRLWFAGLRRGQRPKQRSRR